MEIAAITLYTDINYECFKIMLCGCQLKWVFALMVACYMLLQFGHLVHYHVKVA